MADSHSILVVADLHIDVGRWGVHNDPWATGRAVWRMACDTAIERHPAAFVLAGDIFHTGRPLPEAIQLVNDGINRVRQAGVPVVIVGGNHELAGWPRGHRHVLQLWQNVPGVHVALEPQWIQVEGANIAAVPWPARARMLELFGRLPPGEMEMATSNWIVEQIDQLANSAPADPGVFVGHAMVMGTFLTGSERALAPHPLGARHGPSVPPAGFSGPWDIGILGHVHRHQRVGQDLYYAGSPWTIDFDDADVNHGPLWVQRDSWGTSGIEQLPAPDRRLVDIEVEPDQFPPEQDLEGAIVKITAPDASADRQIALQQWVQERGGQVVRIVTPISKITRAELHPIQVSVSPLEAIRQWVEAQDVDQDRSRRLLRIAEELVGGSSV